MTWRIGISSGACTESPIVQMLPALAASGAHGIEVATGRFGADMQVELVNDGPVTFWLRTPA